MHQESAADEDLLLVGVLGLLFCCRWNCCCCRVGIKLPTLQVRYENLSIDAKCLVGNRALPTLKNATLNFMEVHQPFFLGVLLIPLQDGIHGSWIHDSSLLAACFLLQIMLLDNDNDNNKHSFFT
jgi:hypothetical protein